MVCLLGKGYFSCNIQLPLLRDINLPLLLSQHCSLFVSHVRKQINGLCLSELEVSLESSDNRISIINGDLSKSTLASVNIQIYELQIDLQV